MDKAMKQFNHWHKTKVGYAVMAAVELLIAYIIASRAIDTGSLLEYLLAIIFIIGGLQNLWQFLGHVYRDMYVKR